MWNYSARGRINPYVTRSREGTSYISRTNGTLIAINRAGRELWRRDLGSPICAKVVVGWDGRLFVPTEKKISCFTASGNLLWSKTFDNPFYLTPQLDRSGGIILVLENNEVYRIDPFGSTHIWTLSVKPSVLLSIEQQQILILYMDGTMGILGHSDDWFLSAQGEINSSLFPRFPSAPVTAAAKDNNIAVVFSDGTISLFSVTERKILWTGNSHIREIIRNGIRPEPEAEVIFDERGIYILSKNGATGFSAEGTRLWFLFLQNTSAIPAFGNDGVLYSGGRDWILYAYKTEDRILPERNSLYGPAPDGIYGTGIPRPINLPGFPINEDELRSKINQINLGINSGRVGENELTWTSILMMISAGQHHIQYRMSALNMLGKIGSQETIPWLINFIRVESDPTIRAAAINAVGTIGVDPEGKAIQTFFYLITMSGLKNDQILTAIASATGALCRFSGPPLSETGIRILHLLSADHQPPNVNRQAKIELTSLR
jgi:outer membrane protein assembly factor BamB